MHIKTIIVDDMFVSDIRNLFVILSIHTYMYIFICIKSLTFSLNILSYIFWPYANIPISTTTSTTTTTIYTAISESKY